MFNVGPRGSYLLTMECLPHMKQSFNPQVLTIAPANQFHPAYMNFPSVAYAGAKFSMGTLAMGFAATYPRISFNILCAAAAAAPRRRTPQPLRLHGGGCSGRSALCTASRWPPWA